MNNLAKGAGEQSLVIWRLIDGKPGHENQSLGLCNALADRLSIQRLDIPVKGRLTQVAELFLGRFQQGEAISHPDLIIGAGHSVHIPMLSARRRFGGRCIVLMAPSLPLKFFDLCLIPAHDQITGPNVIQTQGALTAVVPHVVHHDGQLLILLGGPSRHYDWQDARVLEQVSEIAEKNPGVPCLVADSRRTPNSFLARLLAEKLANVEVVNWQQTEPGWVLSQLEKSRAAWVSEDSVSMVYEALSSGLPVGLIELKPHQTSRVALGMQSLKQGPLVTPFETWKQTETLVTPAECFNESARCAEWIQQKWL